MNQLVTNLSQGNHPVILGGPSPDASALQQRIEEIGYVFIKFTDTRGGTDLGIRVDKTATNLSGADFSVPQGSVHIEGTLTLDYVPVRCIANIDLATGQGTGYLVVQA